MILKRIRLTNFKNHPETVFDFSDGINCIVGKNGIGKTNLLDAIYYLSFSKSCVGSQDRLTITHEMNSFTVFGEYAELTLALQFEKGKAKSVKIDGQEPEKLSDLIGKVPLAIVLPDDTSMIKEGSEERRKFFDGALCQFDQEYLLSLMKYNKLLKQRNSLLKQNDSRSLNYKLIETYDDQLIPLAKSISQKRAELCEVFLPFLQKNYADLHEGGEFPSLNFKTHVTSEFDTAFRSNFEKDRTMQRTLLGSHKDDFEFVLDEELIKKFGSQGQKKTFIIALKLALFDFLPASGTNSVAALDKASDLLKQAGIPKGQILLVTDSVDMYKTEARLSEVNEDGITVHVLAVGTAEGAPIPTNQGFLKDLRGQIVIPQVDYTSLQKAAQIGQGRFSVLSNSIDDEELFDFTPRGDDENTKVDETGSEEFIDD
ncbi:MAG: DNA replication and repair protein RecF, partial [Bacteroidota bacterium]